MEKKSNITTGKKVNNILYINKSPDNNVLLVGIYVSTEVIIIRTSRVLLLKNK